MTKKRKGSVLLQTLIMCIVLSYVAVSIAKWGMARYLVGNTSYTSSSAKLESSAGMNVYFSKMPQEGAIPCVSSSHHSSQNAFSYSLKCQTTGNVQRYEFTLSSDNAVYSENNPFE